MTQEPSSCPTTGINTPTESFEIRNMHIALLQSPEDLTQKFSQLNRFIRVIAYCRRFIHHCRQSKANRQATTLSTQDLDQALTCCVKMVQHISYTQEMKDLTEQQEVASSSSLKTPHPFIDKEGLLIHASLPSHASDDFTCKSSFHKTGCLSRAPKTSSCWATISNRISAREVLDSKNQKRSEDYQSSVPDLLQV